MKNSALYNTMYTSREVVVLKINVYILEFFFTLQFFLKFQFSSHVLAKNNAA